MHKILAERLLDLAKRAKIEKTTTTIWQVCDNLPNMLKSKDGQTGERTGAEGTWARTRTKDRGRTYWEYGKYLFISSILAPQIYQNVKFNWLIPDFYFAVSMFR
jgi:hypothetical protein